MASFSENVGSGNFETHECQSSAIYSFILLTICKKKIIEVILKYWTHWSSWRKHENEQQKLKWTRYLLFKWEENTKIRGICERVYCWVDTGKQK